MDYLHYQILIWAHLHDSVPECMWKLHGDLSHGLHMQQETNSQNCKDIYGRTLMRFIYTWRSLYQWEAEQHRLSYLEEIIPRQSFFLKFMSL